MQSTEDHNELLEGALSAYNLKVGSKVIFAKDKTSLSPGKRAVEVSPLPKGDSYSYIVEKYWIVKEIHSDRKVTLITRRGKEHIVDVDDPRLRKASLFERLFQRARFPSLDRTPASGDQQK